MAEMLLPLPCYLRVKDSSLILILYSRIGFFVGQNFFRNAHWKEHYRIIQKICISKIMPIMLSTFWSENGRGVISINDGDSLDTINGTKFEKRQVNL